MAHLLLQESTEICGPSHEDIMASNVLAFLSSSELNTARFPLQISNDVSSSARNCARFLLHESKDLLTNNNSNSSSRNSSASMESFRSSIKRDFCSGFDPVSHDFSDLDDDGLHGDRMKPLSSLKTNCETRMRFSMPQFSRRRGSNSPVNQTPSKVLAAARVGRRARCKAMYYSDNKENNENNIRAHMSEMQDTWPKHKGVKRKSEGHEGNARFLALKRKRSTLSSWRKMTSKPRITPCVSSVTAAVSTPGCKDTQVITELPQRTNLSSKEAAHLCFESLNGVESIERENTISQGSAQCQMHCVANACSTLAFHQGLGLPATGSREETSAAYRADHSGKELHANFPFSKEDDFMGLPFTKPPTYPKDKQSMSTILNLKCSEQLLVDAGCGKDTEFDDQGSRPSSFTVMEMHCWNAKFEEGSGDFTGHEGSFYLAAGTSMGHLSHSVSQFKDTGGGVQSSKTQVEECKIDLPKPSDSAHTLTGLSAHASLSISSGNPCQSDNVLVLAKPMCFANAPVMINSGAAVKLTAVKQETCSEDPADMHLNSQVVDMLHPRNLSTSTREHIKDSARQTRPDSRNGLELPSQLGPPKSKDHPSAWPGVPLYQQSFHNSLSLPKFRRGRPPRKSNLCPCPEPKENANKFARICAPSGVLGKLNPGIITRLRDRKQVHAVLESVIRGAFMTGMKENFKLQGAKEAENADAYPGVHSEHKENSARRRERIGLKEREAILATSDQESAIELALADQDTKAASALRSEKERQGHCLSGVRLDSVNGHMPALGPFGVRKKEQCSQEHAASDVNVHMGYSLPTSDKCSKDVTMDSLEVSEANQDLKWSGEASDDQKVLGHNLSNATTAAESATGNVASCWLELLRLDIKGRLSALKRSRRRVRGVIVSGQLDDSKGKASQVDEMERWRAFFVHMEQVLGSEGTRLESWLNQITQMQSSYCQKKSAGSCMPPSYGIGLLNADMDGASR